MNLTQKPAQLIPTRKVLKIRGEGREGKGRGGRAADLQCAEGDLAGDAGDLDLAGGDVLANLAVILVLIDLPRRAQHLHKTRVGNRMELR